MPWEVLTVPKLLNSLPDCLPRLPFDLTVTPAAGGSGVATVAYVVSAPLEIFMLDPLTMRMHTKDLILILDR